MRRFCCASFLSTHFEGIILKPALTQLRDLNEALQRDNPAMLEVNKAIATASEQSYKVSALRSKGLLDEAACSAKLLDIEGKTFFTMGGASSHDIQDGILEPDDPLLKKKCRRLDASGALYRVNHLSWWKEELPSEEEYQIAKANLDRAGWAVDYIISHCCPTSVQDEMSGGFYKADALTDFLEEVSRRCRFKYHFFGHYHTNRVIREKYVLLYEQIIKLNL